jgi:hypothetical protein
MLTELGELPGTQKDRRSGRGGTYTMLAMQQEYADSVVADYTSFDAERSP